VREAVLTSQRMMIHIAETTATRGGGSRARLLRVSVPPVIDVAALLDDPAARGAAACIADIDRACRDTGFFVAVGHRLDGLLPGVFDAAHRLFALEEATKESLAMVDRRGFVPAHDRRIDPALHAAPMEYYDMEYDGEEHDAANQWPPLDGFVDVMTRYQRAALSTAGAMLRGLALALCLAPAFFSERMRRPPCYLRLMHYPPRSPAGRAREVATAPHTDYGAITLLATDGVDGLEVFPRGGPWTPVVAPAGGLVVNLGDMLARWTNHRYASTPHRVLAPVDRSRYSVPFFVNPDAGTVVDCLPSCVDADQPRSYEPVTAGEFLAMRIAEGGYMTDAVDVPPRDGARSGVRSRAC
jgi:isopenicillin N synthase-like dioxygenase